MKNLDLIDQFYILDKEMMVMNSEGKLVLERSDSIKISASANSSLKLILSILETAN